MTSVAFDPGSVAFSQQAAYDLDDAALVTGRRRTLLEAEVRFLVAGPMGAQLGVRREVSLFGRRYLLGGGLHIWYDVVKNYILVVEVLAVAATPTDTQMKRWMASGST